MGYKFLAAALLCCCAFGHGLASRAEAATLFQDDFESGSLGVWSVSASNDGRAGVTTNHGPASGQWHLVLDDRVDDAIFSVSEATLQLDLSNRRDVFLNFRAKSLGNEPDLPPAGNFVGFRAFDGVSISADGGLTWRTVQSLANLGTAWETFALPLDSAVNALGEQFGAGFRIRFSVFDNAPAPLGGIALDDVSVTGNEDHRVVVELPASLREGDGPVDAYLMLSLPPVAPLTVSLEASPSGHVSMPASVIVPAGRTVVPFTLSAIDDTVLNLTRVVTITPAAPGVVGVSASLSVLDNEVPVATLVLPPQVTEGVPATNNARVVLNVLPINPFPVSLSALPAGEVDLPPTVTLGSGQTQAVFTITAVNDSRIDGDVPVTVTASNAYAAPQSAVITTVDNEPRTLSLSLPTPLAEGAQVSGTVSIPGTLSTNLVVALASSNPQALMVSPTATILAGQLSGSFTATAVDNSLRDGSRLVMVSASANSFIGTNLQVILRDNDPARYLFGNLSNLINISTSIVVTLSAFDVEGNRITGYSGAVDLSLVLPDASSLPVTPPVVNFSNGVWTGNVIVPALGVAPVHLRALDATGRTGYSSPFDIVQVLHLTVADLVWDSLRQRIYASVPSGAGGTNANRILALDPATGQVLTNVLVGQNPGQLLMTSGNEFLYVALNNNGTVARIQPDSMTVLSTFPVGASPSEGTLHVADMCAVAGQPDTLVISRKRLSVSPQHAGVAVYDNGIIRSNKTQVDPGSNIIEPSSDPAIYFGYNTESTEHGFRRLRVTSSGITEIEVNRNLLSGFYLGMRSAGDQVFATSGAVVDGAQMRWRGQLGASGPVCPDLPANRVYVMDAWNRIGAYDAVSLATIRRLSLPSLFTGVSSFIRWGINGFALGTSSNLVLINASQLVPSAPPADIAIRVQATLNPDQSWMPLTYVFTVTNQGPNVARNLSLGVVLSGGQVVQNVVSSTVGIISPSTNLSVLLAELPAAAHTTLTVTALPIWAGFLTCSAWVNADSIDPDHSNNFVTRIVSVGAQGAPNSVRELRLAANNLIYDPGRGLLWATIPTSESGLIARSLVSIDPYAGLASDPIPLSGDPAAGCMALSLDGRYLHIGLSDAPEILRLDLQEGASAVRIPLGLSQTGAATYAQDIEPLPGDGTSFLISGAADHAAAAYDGAVRRPTRTGISKVSRLAPTGTPGVYIGYNGVDLSRLSVTTGGVSVLQSTPGVISGFGIDIQGQSNLVLSSSGLLVDATTLVLRFNLSDSGRPCLDLANGRVYLVSGRGTSIRAYDPAAGGYLGAFWLEVSPQGDWARACVRWGYDGLAVLGEDGRVYLVRWSAVARPLVDADADGIEDAWEIAHFGGMDAGLGDDSDADGLPLFLEYLFVTSPVDPSPNPLQVSVLRNGGNSTLRLVFPRRLGLNSRYGFVLSTNFLQWTPAVGVTQRVLRTETRNGVAVETVQALIPQGTAGRAFARFQWLQP